MLQETTEPLSLSIAKTAELTGESEWTVKQKLRSGVYKAKKSGRRTLISYESIKTAWADLPAAKFSPPTRKHARGG
jgi:hypothetical protein